MKLRDIIEPKPQEEVLLIVRASFYSFAWMFAGYALLVCLPFFFFYPAIQYGWMGIGLFSAVLMIGIFHFWKRFIIWSRTMFIVTSVRLIDVDQEGFFDRTVTELRFDQIQDVHYRSKGLRASLFRYGTLYITTKGDAADIQVNHVPKPQRLQQLVHDLIQATHE